jgi:hypothetical protein
MAKKGKTPSLLSMSTGTPSVHTCGRASSCDRCDDLMAKGVVCFQIPKLKSGFTSRPIFCVGCTAEIVAKTKSDLLEIEATVRLHH